MMEHKLEPEVAILTKRLRRIADDVVQTAVGSSRIEMYRSLADEIVNVSQAIDAIRPLLKTLDDQLNGSAKG